MAAWLGETRGGCMVIIRPRKRRFRKAQRRARHKARNIPPCKQWHGEAALHYHDQLVKDRPLRPGLIPDEAPHDIPEASPCHIPSASHITEPLPLSRDNDTAAPAQGKETYVAWFDGACEPFNPGGTASFGIVIKDRDGVVLLRDHAVVGNGKEMSNNLAEYAGARQVLRYLASLPPGRITIHGDSNLVINQLKGRWRIKKGLYLPIAMETKQLLAHLRGLGWQISFCWIPREQNEECDALSKRISHSSDKPDSMPGVQVPG